MIEFLQLANSDNEIGNVYREGNEYIVEVNLWNGNVIKLRTTGCNRITHNINLVDEFGDILIKDGIYRFMTVDSEDIILEIAACDLCPA